MSITEHFLDTILSRPCHFGSRSIRKNRFKIPRIISQKNYNISFQVKLQLNKCELNVFLIILSFCTIVFIVARGELEGITSFFGNSGINDGLDPIAGYKDARRCHNILSRFTHIREAQDIQSPT